MYSGQSSHVQCIIVVHVWCCMLYFDVPYCAQSTDQPQDLNEYKARRVEVAQWVERVGRLQHSARMILHVTPTAKVSSMKKFMGDTVLDKLKADFSAKVPADNCVRIVNPAQRDGSKPSSEMWHHFTKQLQDAMCASIDQR
eukprot:m.108292 g.108292  ORF g.108292 m.108292 type:complete len:141 (-) comp13340_c0_seq4:338-760(-)